MCGGACDPSGEGWASPPVSPLHGPYPRDVDIPLQRSRISPSYCSFEAMDARVVELEVRLSYQDKLIADLDEVLQTFTRRVESLERELAELKSAIEQGTPQVGPADEKPPHY